MPARKTEPKIIDKSTQDRESAQLRYDLLKDALRHSEDQENSYSNRFVELQIEVASIVVGLMGGAAILGKDFIGPSWIYIVGSILLILSLLLGVLTTYLVKVFWHSTMIKNRTILNIWRSFLINGGDYAQANVDAHEVAGTSNIAESPRWPYLLQSIALILGLIFLASGVFMTITEKHDTSTVTSSTNDVQG